MTAIRCIILDDELLALSYLQLLCSDIEGVEVVKAYQCPETFLRDFRTDLCDVCIMDINMPGISGLQVAARIAGTQVIFTTAHKEYAAEAFDLNVVDYVRKPLQKERLQQALSKVSREKIHSSKYSFEWNTGLGRTTIFTRSLLYFRTSTVDSRDKYAFLEDGTVLTLKNISFRDLIALLPLDRFIQINKKEVIALRTVQAFTGNEIIIRNPGGGPLKFILTEIFRPAFLKALER